MRALFGVSRWTAAALRIDGLDFRRLSRSQAAGKAPPHKIQRAVSTSNKLFWFFVGSIAITWFQLVPAGTSWYLLAPAGTRWYQLVSADTSWFCWYQLVPAGTSW